jgi:hypothetical protein
MTIQLIPASTPTSVTALSAALLAGGVFVAAIQNADGSYSYAVDIADGQPSATDPAIIAIAGLEAAETDAVDGAAAADESTQGD